jgi:hypothetical protein
MPRSQFADVLLARPAHFFCANFVLEAFNLKGVILMDAQN